MKNFPVGSKVEITDPLFTKQNLIKGTVIAGKHDPDSLIVRVRFDNFKYYIDEYDCHTIQNENNIKLLHEPNNLGNKDTMNYASLKPGDKLDLEANGTSSFGLNRTARAIVVARKGNRLLLKLDNSLSIGGRLASHCNFADGNEKVAAEAMGFSVTANEYWYISEENPGTFKITNLVLSKNENNSLNVPPKNISLQEFSSIKRGDIVEVRYNDKSGNPVISEAVAIGSYRPGNNEVTFYFESDIGTAVPATSLQAELADGLGLDVTKKAFRTFSHGYEPSFFITKIVSRKGDKKVAEAEPTVAVKAASIPEPEAPPAKDKLLDLVQKDLERAGYRVASTQVTKGIKAGLLLMLKDKGVDSQKISVFQEFMETEFGTALISTLLGYGLTYVPHINADPRVQKMAEEFRVHGMATVGNEVMGIAFQYLMPTINDTIKSLSTETPQTQIRVESSTKAEAESAEANEEEVLIEVDTTALQLN